MPFTVPIWPDAVKMCPFLGREFCLLVCKVFEGSFLAKFAPDRKVLPGTWPDSSRGFPLLANPDSLYLWIYVS